MHEQCNQASGLAGAQAVLPVNDIQTIRNEITKLAAFAEQIGKAMANLADTVIGLEKRLNETEVNTRDVRPQLLVLKGYSESIPVALRQAKRSEIAMEKRIADLEARLAKLESPAAAETT